MSKLVALFAIAALLATSIPTSSEARPITAFAAGSVGITHQDTKVAHEDGCKEGSSAERDDCVIRRTLEAHVDYIYSGEIKQ